MHDLFRYFVVYFCKMLISLKISNFGSIKDEQLLSFEATRSTHLEDYYIVEPIKGLRLLKLCLIYGANASGKTTILKALEFLRDLVLDPVEKKTDNLKYNPFLFDPNTPGQNSILSIEFVENKTRYFYEVEFNKRAIIKEELNFYNPNKANVFKRTTDLNKQFSEIAFGSKIKTDKVFEKTLEANTIWNNTVLGGFLKTNIENNELKEVTEWFSSYLRPLVFSRTELESYITVGIDKGEINKSTIIEILKKADLNISDIIIEDDTVAISDKIIKVFEAFDISNDVVERLKSAPLKKLQFEHTINNSKYFLPFNLESQGTQRYFGFAGLLSLLLYHPTFIPIDELESSLHPDLYMHFILSFITNSKFSQILGTTHNREILNNKDIFRNDAIWFTDKTENCSTKLYSLSDFDSSIIRDTSNVYNAYKIGKLGGIPHLQDYYLDLNNEKK